MHKVRHNHDTHTHPVSCTCRMKGLRSSGWPHKCGIPSGDSLTKGVAWHGLLWRLRGRCGCGRVRAVNSLNLLCNFLAASPFGSALFCPVGIAHTFLTLFPLLPIYAHLCTCPQCVTTTHTHTRKCRCMSDCVWELLHMILTLCWPNQFHGSQAFLPSALCVCFLCVCVCVWVYLCVSESRCGCPSVVLPAAGKLLTRSEQLKFFFYVLFLLLPTLA